MNPQHEKKTPRKERLYDEKTLRRLTGSVISFDFIFPFCAYFVTVQWLYRRKMKIIICFIKELSEH